MFKHVNVTQKCNTTEITEFVCRNIDMKTMAFSVTKPSYTFYSYDQNKQTNKKEKKGKKKRKRKKERKERKKKDQNDRVQAKKK